MINNYSVNLLAADSDPALASVVFTGVVIVFSMLVLFVILFGIFGKIMTAVNSPKKPKEKVESKPQTKSAPVAATVASAPASDDDVIAVISAAVYSVYEGSGKRPVIKSIKPATRSGKSAWAMAGVLNNIRSF